MEDYDARTEEYRQQYIQSQTDDAQGKVRPAPGQQVVLPTGEDAAVVAADGDNITVALGDGTRKTVQLAELQRAMDEKTLADYDMRHGTDPGKTGQPQDEAGQETAGAPAARRTCRTLWTSTAGATIRA